MALISFKDKCIITRARTDEANRVVFDDNGERIVDVLYDDKCLYIRGTESANPTMIRNDKVYLPTNDVSILDGDSIKVRTSRGREVSGTIMNPRDVEMPLTHTLYTIFELNQGEE